MSQAVVGALRVTLGLDSAQFTTGMKTAQTGLQRFAGVAKAGALAIGTAMVAAGGAMALAMKGVIDRADQMYEASQALGVTVEDLSRLQYAADLSGVSAENLEKSIRKLSVGLYDASQNATGPAATAFRTLGISATDAAGNIRPAIDVIGDLAKRFETLPDGAAKTALAIKVFGRSGADMIPMLNEGEAGLRAMYEEAQQLGVVLDTETAAAAERFNDNLTRLGKTQDGIVTKITAGMLPSLDRLIASLAGASRNTEGLKTVGRGLGIVMNSIIAVFVGVAGAIWAAGLNMAAFVKTMERVIHLDFAGAAAAWELGSGRAMNSIRGTLSQINALFSTVEAGNTALPALAEDLEDVSTASGGARRSTERLTAAQRDQQQAAAEMAREAAQVYEQTRTPAEQYATEVERLTRLLNAAAISQDTFNRAMREANIRRDAEDPLSQAGQRIAEQNREEAEKRREDAIQFAADHEENLRASTYDGIRSGLQAAADGNLGQYLAQRLRDALFDGLADTLTNMLRGPKGSSGGGAMGWLGAVGSVLKTFAGGLPGFKTGGSFKVGGSGGADSQLMQFRATPGEMVDIRRPGQDQRGGQMAVHVVPSPYFDVRVEKVSTPIAARAGVQSFGAARSQVPADQARRARFSLGAR
jgi:hypothetical protein